MKTISLNKMITVFAILFALASTTLIHSAFAEDLSAVKSRMSNRLGSIDKLKSAGKVGEANTGFLAEKSAMTSAEKSTMKAENADRKVVYTAIAEGKKTTAASVGALRAASLRKSSAKNVWLQDPKGKWYKKL